MPAPVSVSALLRVDFRRAIQGLDWPRSVVENGFPAPSALDCTTQSRHPDFYRGSESEEPVVGASEVLGFRKTVR